MPEISIARLPFGSDPIRVLGHWLVTQKKAERMTVWIVSSVELANDLRSRLQQKHVHITDLQTLADDLIRTHHPTSRFVQPRHYRMLAAETRSDDTPVSYGYAQRLAGTISELKRAGIEQKVWPATLREMLEKWERARVNMGLLDEEDRLLRAAELWCINRTESYQSVVVSGFDSFTIPENALFAAIVNSAQRVALALPQSTSFPAWIDERDEPERIEIESTDDPDIHRIHAPGVLGECRLIARQLREWIDSGIAASNIVVTSRHIEQVADQLQLVCDDFGIPLSGIEPPVLIRTPTVATLLRAWRLPLDDFPFAAVGGLLRSGLFQPTWIEPKSDREVPLKAEALLRTLGRPSGKESYLAALQQKIVAPLPPLEDEAGDQPRQVRIEALAGYCRPFLHRFFQMWDDITAATSAAKWVERLNAFAVDLGLEFDESLTQFFAECDDWAKADAPAMKLKRITLTVFIDIVERIASDTSFTSPHDETLSVRLLAPAVARHTPCEILVVMNLGEGSFPDTAPPVSLLSESDRTAFESELLPTNDSRLRAEKALFSSLVGRPQRHLLLSRQAVDEKGQELLPSSLLLEWEADHPTISSPFKQKMPIEGFAEEIAYSASESRVQAARMLRVNPQFAFGDKALSPSLLDTLKRAQHVAECRFRETAFGEFDGTLTDPKAIDAVKTRFQPERTISPSSLEKYVSCPFRFWLEQVLRLETLEVPTAEIEVTRRGQAVHRAMARYHRAVRSGEKKLALSPYISDAAAEYGERSGTQVGKVLWQLEGQRLQRGARKYAAQWEKFRGQWADVNAIPIPAKFEQSFGGKTNPLAEAGAETLAEPLVIEVDGVIVKIGGTVDRIDAVELEGERGFWVIDYKTGRASNYTGVSVTKFEALQLPLYALAIERTIFADRPSRPLGLAFWMIGDGGAKTVLPARGAKTWLSDPSNWHKFREQLEKWVAKLAVNIRTGLFPLTPKSETCTAMCPFGPTCRIAQGRDKAKQFTTEGTEDAE